MMTLETRWRRSVPLIVCALVMAFAAGCPPLDPSPDPDPGDGDVNSGEIIQDGDLTPDDDITDDEIVLPDFGDPAAPLYSDAALSPDGRYLLVQVAEGDEQPCLVVADLNEGTTAMPDGLCGLRWLGFSPHSQVAYCLRSGGDRVSALQLADLVVIEDFDTQQEYTVLDVSPDGGTVALSNVPSTVWAESQYEWNTEDEAMRRLAVIRTEPGTVAELSTAHALRDVAFSPVDGAVLGVSSRWKGDGMPEAQVYFVDPGTGALEKEITFMNCADELAIQPGGIIALLSPNQCMVHPVIIPPEEEEEWPPPEDEWDEWEDWDDGDPVSVIDLETREFVGNLPGFGPLAFSPDGETAVAFSRRETLMSQWNIFQQALVGLVFIRMADLYWSVLEYGEDEPDYFIDPSGAHLYLHDREDNEDRIVRLDMADQAMTVLDGPPTHLDGRALTPDGGAIFVVAQDELRRVSVGGTAVDSLSLTFVPGQVFARPQGDTIVVSEADLSAVHLVDPATGSVVSSLSL